MVKLFLYPFSWLYGIVIYFRNKMYDFKILKSTKFDLPVISIGNITVGGTGKTPHLEYLVNLLKDRFIVATLSRGYKRQTKGFRLVETNSAVLEVGDEPLQVKKKFPDVSVAVCENRVEGVEKLLNQNSIDIPHVVLLDDAFQHRRITPGINILLIDYNRQIKEDFLLPAGRLRENVSQVRRADIIIYTKCPQNLTPFMRRSLGRDIAIKPYQELYFTTLNYEELKPVFTAKKLEVDFYKKKLYSALIVTGIASPHLMHKYLDRLLIGSEKLIFKDHCNFTKEDIASIQKKYDGLKSEKKIIITTEKDAVRLREREDLPDAIKKVLYHLPIKVTFMGDEGKSFNDKILNYAGENKSNSQIH
jgi:tetraacyldisaccharide 4'-kinase